MSCKVHLNTFGPLICCQQTYWLNFFPNNICPLISRCKIKAVFLGTNLLKLVYYSNIETIEINIANISKSAWRLAEEEVPSPVDTPPLPGPPPGLSSPTPSWSVWLPPLHLLPACLRAVWPEIGRCCPVNDLVVASCCLSDFLTLTPDWFSKICYLDWATDSMRLFIVFIYFSPISKYQSLDSLKSL